MHRRQSDRVDTLGYTCLLTLCERGGGVDQSSERVGGRGRDG